MKLRKVSLCDAKVVAGNRRELVIGIRSGIVRGWPGAIKFANRRGFFSLGEPRLFFACNRAPCNASNWNDLVFLGSALEKGE